MLLIVRRTGDSARSGGGRVALARDFAAESRRRLTQMSAHPGSPEVKGSLGHAPLCGDREPCPCIQVRQNGSPSRVSPPCPSSFTPVAGCKDKNVFEGFSNLVAWLRSHLRSRSLLTCVIRGTPRTESETAENRYPNVSFVATLAPHSPPFGRRFLCRI